MAQSPARPLTDGEIALARRAFDAWIDYSSVRIRHGAGGNPIAALAFRNGNGAITLLRTIYFNGAPVADYSTGGDPHLFIHEMTHVWQYRRLGAARFFLRYARDFIAARFDAKAMYCYEKGDCFEYAALEAQAEMVADYSVALWSADAAGLAKLARNMKGSGLYGL